MPLTVSDQRLPPARGLICLQNHRGHCFSPIDARRWLRLNRIVFNAEKVDILVAERTIRLVPELMSAAADLDMAASLRTPCDCLPPDLGGRKDKGLLDVFLTPANPVDPWFQVWLDACHEAGLPVRVQLHAPFDVNLDAESVARRFSAAGVVSVNVAAYDPFVSTARARNATQARVSVEKMNALARAFETAGIEANLIGLPFCQTSEANWPNVVNSRQFQLDHQQYNRAAYDLARNLYRNFPRAVSLILLIQLARATYQRSFVDAVLLRVLLHARLLYGTSVALHKLTRQLRVRRLRSESPSLTLEDHERALGRRRRRERAELGPVCSTCSLRRICDRIPAELRRALPGLEPKAIPGELVVSPLHFALDQPKHYDAVDAERATVNAGAAEMAKRAMAIVENETPDRQIMPYEYTVEGAPWEHLEGGVRWHSITNSEKQSSSLERLEPPFTLSVTFGGGIAEHIGFSFGRHCKLLCPMEGYRHTVVLHVDADGHYVLLRDGKLVRPVEFEGVFYTPLRLGGLLDPRISIWNIDGQIVTQFVKIWRGEKRPVAPQDVKYSIVIVNTRYARRLQATLRAIAHQEGIDPRKLEVIICYVPGLDATDDLIDSMQASFPRLRILRSPFPAQNAHSKGFMINESVRMASGEWLVLMDADIIIAPNMFARIEQVADSSDFIAPDGRLMTTKETTAKILLGEIEPWKQWPELVNGAGEYRYREAKGVPVGFFQCFKRSFIDEVKYAELDHFEGADMWFGMALQDRFGKETRLSGLPVLHLDHGGSQWYGTQKHW